MISYDDALQLIRQLQLPLGSRRLPLEACVGHVLAEDLTAKVPSPPFTNAAMDGYAVCLEEARQGPLEVRASVYARVTDPAAAPTGRQPGEAVRIMTGAPLPSWADTVIPVELSREGEGGLVSFTSLPPPGANIRREGEDLPAGALLMAKGELLHPDRIMVAAAFGYQDLAVRQRPHLHFLSTGDELVEVGEPLPPGGVYNSSKYFLLAAARQLGLTEVAHRTIPDDEAAAEHLIATLTARAEPTLLVSTGAVSAGELDFIPRLGAKLGFQALFHKVAIRPGKPVYLATRGPIIWLGLPGNPVSTAVGWHFFARPLLAATFGLPEPERRAVVIKNEVKKPEDLRCFFRAEIRGQQAWVSRRQGSAQLAASLTNEAYVELPEGVSRIPADTRVQALIL